jgi:hypothetical protein
MISSKQTDLNGAIIKKPWSRADWENYYSDMHDHIEIVEEGLRRAGL